MVAAVVRHVDVLAAHVEHVVIVRRQRQRRRPNEAVLEAVRRPADRRLRPDLDVLHELRAPVVSRYDSAHRARPRTARPNQIAVYRVRPRPAALATADRQHVATADGGNVDADAEVAGACVARHHRRWAVLAIAVDVVGNLVVDLRVVHLPERELRLDPRLAAIDRHRYAAVVAHDHAVAVGRIDPDVVVIATGILGEGRVDDGCAAVERLRPVRGEEVRLVRVVRRHAHPVVVVRPPRHLAVAAHELPRVASIVRAKEPAAIGRFAIGRGNAIARLDLGVDAVRHRLADAEANLADRLGRETVGELGPGRATIGGLPDATPRAAAGATPRLDLDLPESRVENARVRRVHNDVARARRVIDKQHALPILAAVGRAIDAALGLRAVGEA